MTNYYDYVLGVIPLIMIGTTGILTYTGFDIRMAIPVASIIAAGIIGHAMFIRAPTDPTPDAEVPQQNTVQRATQKQTTD